MFVWTTLDDFAKVGNTEIMFSAHAMLQLFFQSSFLMIMTHFEFIVNVHAWQKYEWNDVSYPIKSCFEWSLRTWTYYVFKQTEGRTRLETLYVGARLLFNFFFTSIPFEKRKPTNSFTMCFFFLCERVTKMGKCKTSKTWLLLGPYTSSTTLAKKERVREEKQNWEKAFANLKGYLWKIMSDGAWNYKGTKSLFHLGLFLNRLPIQNDKISDFDCEQK